MSEKRDSTHPLPLPNFNAPLPTLDLTRIARLNPVTLPPFQSPPTRVSGRLPPKTPATALGISAEAVKLLTPAAAKLTRQNLTDLAGSDGAAVAVKLKLTVADINSVKVAFAAPIFLGGVGVHGVSFSVSCCCCTPCCCAAAALNPVTKVV